MYQNVGQLAHIHQAELLAEARNERLIRSLPKKAGRGSLVQRLVAKLVVRAGNRPAEAARETTGAI